jgi:signal peptidase I
MTYEEFESLEPGDEVVFTLEDNYPDDNWIRDVYGMQEKHGGTLTIKKVFPRPKDSEYPGGTDFWIENDKIGFVYEYKWFELCKKPNLPWSYEKDY